MTTKRNNKERIFSAAVELDVDQRRAFLDAACGNDDQLRAEVESLLRHDGQASDFIERPAVNPPATDVFRPISEGAGTVVGPYKLLQQIGEGGFGVVYMAEQQQPVRRKVALKIIKPGMDSRQVIARFEAERQALAMMDHPNIAKVLDAGTTETGRPFFVMELVRGIPINEFCDQKRLSVSERLHLMIQVCQAVQHAHQKGIIHRDLKPTNVLVTMHDAVAVPKVIDFGIAKALGQSLTDHTLHTGFAQMIGTPLYMSPEQAEMNQFGVDTRSDVYSLGVLLYELLTGTTPFDKETLTKAGLDEMRRIIREDEPLRPSARVSTLNAQALSTVSKGRNTDPRRISIILRGELDWIVMKALEKDRSRRYESPSSLAADIQRYLNGELVQACPPSALYRFRKFTRKNKASITTTALIAAALLLGTLISTYQALRAIAAEVQASSNETKANAAAAAEAKQRERAEFNEQRALAAAASERSAKEAEAGQRLQAEKNLQAALDAIDKLLSRIDSPEIQDIPNARKVQTSMVQDALNLYDRLAMNEHDSAAIRHRAAQTWMRIAMLADLVLDADTAQRSFVASLDILRSLVATDRGSLEYLQSLGEVLTQYGMFRRRAWRDLDGAIQKLDEAQALFAELARRSQTPSARDAALDAQVGCLVNLSLAVENRHGKANALEYIDKALDIGGQIRSPTARMMISAIRRKANLLADASVETTDALYRDAIARHREWAQNNPELNTSGIQGNLANALHEAANSMKPRLPAEADTYYTESLEIRRKIIKEIPLVSVHRRRLTETLREFGRHHRRQAANLKSAENADQKAHRLAQAHAMFQEAIESGRQLVASHPDVKAQVPRLWLPYQEMLAALLQEQASFILQHLAPTEANATVLKLDSDRKQEADALLVEAIIICRALAAEFPDNAEYKRRLATLLKLQAQHFGEPKAAETKP